MKSVLKLAAIAVLALLPLSIKAQPANPYELPDPLRMDDGRTVRTKRQWIKERRPELMETLRSQMFGREPGQAALDVEGMQTMRTMAENMAWLLKKIHADGNPGYPEREEWQPMNFIR